MKRKGPSRRSCARVTFLTTRKSRYTLRNIVAAEFPWPARSPNPGSIPLLARTACLMCCRPPADLPIKLPMRPSISHRDQEDATTVHISKDPVEMAASNVDLKPGDTVVVPKAGIVYVLGEVTRPGGYVLNSTGGITVLQVVAVAGGPTHIAAAGKTRLLRRTENGFQEQQINLTKLLRGKAHDVSVRNEDILFIPSSAIKTALNASALVGVAASTAIYRIP